MIIIATNKKIHEAEAMETPKKNKKVVIYMGCLE